MRRILLTILLGAVGLACGRQPCDPEDLETGPRVRIDLSLGYCNLPPVPEITTRSRVSKNTKVELDGAGSVEPNDDPMTFTWTLAVKPAGSSAVLTPNATKASFTPDVTGSYEVQLTISDGELTSAPKSIVIAAENDAPTSDAGENQMTDFGVAVGLDGSRSQDPNGDALRYSWSFAAAPGSTAILSDASAINPTFFADVRGRYEATLVVHDGEAASVGDVVVILAGISATPPIARINAPTTALTGSQIAVDGVGSSDPDGDPLTFRWTLSPGPVSSRAVLADPTANRTTFTADDLGAYTVQLVVNDGFYDSPPATIVIVAERSPSMTGAATFDPDVMHFLAGSNAGSALGVICEPTTFNQPSAGLPGGSRSAFVRPTDGKLIYVDTGSFTIREFVPDPLVLDAMGTYEFPLDPTANDPIIPSPRCTGTEPVFAIVIHPVTGALYYSCIDMMFRLGAFYDQAGNVLVGCPMSDVLALSTDGAVLGNACVYDANGVAHVTSATNHTWVPRARPVGGGFWVIRPNGLRFERWSIGADGSEVLDLTYGELPAAYAYPIPLELPRTLTLDAEGNLYTYAVDSAGIRAIFEFEAAGGVHLAYESFPERLCSINGTAGTILFSGP